MLHSAPVSNLFDRLRIADLANQAKVAPATVRYYSRIGLLHPDRDADSSDCCFEAADLRRVIFARQAQALGLAISDIKVMLESADKDDPRCH
jgi:MerR family transcriptional regulator, Zn(II)-responsive regulator of zntA